MSNSPRTLSDVLVEGARVRLRPVRPADAPAAFPLVHGVRPVLDWLCWQGPRDQGELREAYSTWRAESPTGDNYHLAVEALADGTFLGTASLRYADHPHIGDLGYWLGVPHHGRGYGTDLVGLLVHIGLELLGSTALSAEVFPGNTASVRVLERNGFRLARRARDRSPTTCGAAMPVGPGDGGGQGGQGDPGVVACQVDPLRPRDQFLMLATDRPAGSPRPTLVRFER